MFNFYGEVIHAAINYPESWHDTKLASVSELYFPKLLDAMTPPGTRKLGDSAFVNNTTCTNRKIVRAKRTSETQGIPHSKELAAIDVIMQPILPSERQSAECGIRAIKAPFNPLKPTLTADACKRANIIGLAVRLFNYCTREMGCNRIESTYNPTRMG